MQLAIELCAVSKAYANGVQALVDCSFRVGAGEWLALVGPSGCGKTTTLRLIAGLEAATAGSIKLAGQAADSWPPAARNVAMMFQRPALFPHKTVRDNLAFGLRVGTATLSRPEIEQRVVETARWLKVHELLDRYPRELSGGQQQRVALGRALVRRTAIGLLDEPFGNLDAPLRKELRRELPLLRDRLPATMIIVTHDAAEACALGDRVGVLENGRLVQLDTPAALKGNPRTAFVAEMFKE